jgi:hypothetical protein
MRKGAGYVRHHHNRMRLRRSGKLLLAIAAAGFFLAACGGGKPSAGVTTTSGASGHSTTTAPKDGSTTVPSSPTTTVPYAVAQLHTGSGSATLAEFKVPSSAKEWDIDWVYYCSSSPTTVGTFQITVVGHGSTANTTDAGVTQPSGPGTAGIVKNYDTGTFNLKVTTTCTWRVRVEVLS